MTAEDLRAAYEAYIACLNRRDLAGLDAFVGENVAYNGKPVGLDGYRRMLAGDYHAIPDLRYRIALLVAEPPRIAARLDFDCVPKASFMGLPVNGRRLRFSENVFYGFEDCRIVDVWSVIDKAAIERQLKEETATQTV